MGEGERSIQNLPLTKEAIDFFSKEWGITNLHPPQFEAMKPLFEENNILLAIPTASGKSLVAYIAILNQLIHLNPGSRAVYIVPLKALASEKFDELKEIGQHLGLKIGLGIGDATSEAKNIDDSDILICTSEKLDSLMRTRSELMSNVSIVVADEFHLLHDASRGPTLEINLTRLRTLRPNAQLIALSATVGNCDILAKWLDATLVQSDWRPVDLEYATLHDRHLEPRKIQSSSMDSSKQVLSPPRHLEGPLSHPSWIVVQDTIEQGGQVLVFVGTRRSAQSEAKKLSERVKKRFAKEQPERLLALDQLAESLEGRTQTSMGELLAHCVRGGVAFHHAGLTHKQRQTIESGFKSGTILALCATPTLAAGVNLPARRVLVRDIKRWDDGMSRPLPVMEVHQMLGRAGRPRYDPVGEAWVLCKGTDGWQVADEVSERYFFGPIEDISSKLSAEPAMRMHLLSCIATGGLLHRESIGSFFDATFLGTTMPTSQLHERLDSMLDWLVEERFLRRLGIDESYELRRQDRAVDEEESWDDDVPVWVNVAQDSGGVRLVEERTASVLPSSHGKPSLGFVSASSLNNVGGWSEAQGEPPAMKYEATPMGERVSQLYLDPLSASILRTGMRRAVRRMVRQDGPVSEFGLTHLACSTPDFASLWAKTADLTIGSDLQLKAASVEDELLYEIPYEERHLGLVKSAWCLEHWFEEETMREIEKQLDVSPGDVHHRVDLMDWLLYASREILLTDDVFADEHMPILAQLSSNLDTLRQRVRHGCKPDLLKLVKIRHVGRQRARSLASIGIRTPKDVLGMTHKDQQKIASWRGWGPKLVSNIMSEVRKVIQREDGKAPTKRRGDDMPLDGEDWA